jgi:PII interaction protein X
MNSESYINHPTFGLLYRICPLEDDRELFTTLYAQRMFFVVTNTPTGLSFQPVSRSDARMSVDVRLRLLRRNGELEEAKSLQSLWQQNFSS